MKNNIKQYVFNSDFFFQCSAFVGSRLQTLASRSGASCPSVKAQGPSPQRWAEQSSTCLLRRTKLPSTVGQTWNTTCTGEMVHSSKLNTNGFRICASDNTCQTMTAIKAMEEGIKRDWWQLGKKGKKGNQLSPVGEQNQQFYINNYQNYTNHLKMPFFFF